MESSEIEQEQAGGSRGPEVVAAWLESGEPLEQYCQRTGQSVWSLRRWRREHAEQFGIAIKRRLGARRQAQSPPKATMIPVEIVTGNATAGAPTTIEVRLPRQRSIVVSCGIDAPTLTRLVTAVEAAL